jgi:5,10-methylenetetrahydromethanopterin reductase
MEVNPMFNTAITMNPGGTLQQMIKTVRLAEELNFSTCYIADQGFTYDLYVTLTALALNTSRIRIGPGVTHAYTRHPVVTAVSIASLDQFSGGRAFLGLGAGGSRTLVPLQIQRSKPMELSRETVEIARLLWQGKTVNYRGEFFNLNDARLGFSCRPDIEIHWAARGPKMLELGGELADVNLLFGIPRFALGDVTATVRRGAQKANRPIRLQYSVIFIYDERSREEARPKVVYRLVDSSEEVKSKLGLNEEKIAEIRNLVTTFGPKSAAHLVDDEMLSNYVIQGEPDACAGLLRQLISAHGLTGITVEVPDPANAEKLLTFAADVINRI